jgi:phosphoglycolate phosphatase
MTRRFDAVLFDLDGTLADTLQDIANAANFALGRLGHAPIETPRFRYLAGQGLKNLMIAALGPAHQHQVEEAMGYFRGFYADHFIDNTRPFAGMADVLDELVRRGLPMAVLSNKPHPATMLVMEKVFGRWRFASVVGHKPEAPLKPDPTSAFAIAARLNVPAERWLYVGDTRVDMETAVNAGMFPVGVLWGFRDEPELRASGAKVIITEPRELLDLL